MKRNKQSLLQTTLSYFSILALACAAMAFTAMPSYGRIKKTAKKTTVKKTSIKKTESKKVKIDTLALSYVKTEKIVKVKKTSSADFMVYAQYIKSGSELLQKTVNSWIDMQIRQTMSSISNNEFQITESALEGSALVKAYEKEYLAKTKKAITSSLKAQKDSIYPLHYTLTIEIRKIYENNRAFTLAMETSYYSNTPQPKQTTTFATFRKSDAHIMTWNDIISKAGKEKFSGYIVQGLQSFFGSSSFVGMRDKLTIKPKPTITHFPTPEGNPGFTNDGLQITYAKGEIADASYGQPSICLPYNFLRTIFTPSGKALVW